MTVKAGELTSFFLTVEENEIEQARKKCSGTFKTNKINQSLLH